MRGDVNGIEFDGHMQVFRGFFKILPFLQEFVPKSIPSQKSIRLLHYHLPKRFNIQNRTGLQK
jgi:hypothetical protein